MEINYHDMKKRVWKRATTSFPAYKCVDLGIAKVWTVSQSGMRHILSNYGLTRFFRNANRVVLMRLQSYA